LVFGVCLGLGLALAPLTAAADIAPPGLCASDEVGEACDEAVDENGTELDAPGVCVAEQCTRGTPNGPMKYACVMCRPESNAPTAGGAGGAESYPAEPSAGAAGTVSEPTGGRSGNGPVNPTAGSGGKEGSGKGGSATTAGKPANGTNDGKDDGGCSIGLGGGRSGVVTVSSLLACALVLGRRRWQRRA
jgi:hypothetical protein